MARMTEEEAFALDKKWTETTPKIGHNGSGFIAKRKEAQNVAHLIAVDGSSYDYLFAKAIADHKTPAEVISDMIQERLAAAFRHGELSSNSQSNAKGEFTSFILAGEREPI